MPRRTGARLFRTVIGTCAVACPSGAISIRHFTDEMIETMMEAYLRPTDEQGSQEWPEADVGESG